MVIFVDNNERMLNELKAVDEKMREIEVDLQNLQRRVVELTEEKRLLLNKKAAIKRSWSPRKTSIGWLVRCEVCGTRVSRFRRNSKYCDNCKKAMRRTFWDREGDLPCRKEE